MNDITDLVTCTVNFLARFNDMDDDGNDVPSTAAAEAALNTAVGHDDWTVIYSSDRAIGISVTVADSLAFDLIPTSAA